MFRLTTDPIGALGLEDDQAGGFVTFEGKVRDWSEGRRVERLEYEAFAPLAEAEGQRILDEATAMFDLRAAAVLHRVGLLDIGETAVRIEVAAPHRHEAFQACEYVIDELKRRVPIWKKEHYADGDSGWIGVESAVPLTATSEFYRRQTILAEVGEAGQQRLAAARVLVVGAGGLGCAALPYLAGAGIGHLGICDGDAVDVTNLHRQVLFGYAERGMPKAERAASAVTRLNPFIEVRVHDERLDASNAASIVSGYDVVLDGTDNFTTKFLLNDICWELGRPLVQASLHQFEGQLLVVDPRTDGGCLRCIWPEAPYDGCVGTCAEEGVLGVVPGIFGVLQANEVLKLILGLDGVLTDAMLLLDLRTYAMQRLNRTRLGSCPTCGVGQLPTQIDVSLKDALAKPMLAIDIREPVEWNEIPGFETCERIPLSASDRLYARTRDAASVLLICEHGIRSAHAARWLRQSGVKAFSLIGGAEAARRGAR